MALLARTGGRAIRTTLRATTIAAGNVAQPAARQGLRQSFSRSCSSTAASAEREAAVAKVKDVLQNDPALTEAVVESMCVKSRRELVRLAIKADGNMAAAEFRLADKNQDGLLDLKEFQGWLVASAQKGGREGLGQVTRQQMIQYGVLISVPMIGFGFVDNVIMITAGDWIDNHLGLAFGLSTLAAAGFGNLISDVAGLGLGGYIEASADKLGIKNPNLTQLQEATSRVRTVRNVATVGGITLGCLLGMVPLFFIDEEKRMLRQVFDELDTAGASSRASRASRASPRGGS